MIIKVKVKGNLIGKWAACTSTKGKGRALRLIVVHFPMILVFQCMFLKERVKENVRDLVPHVPLLLQGEVGETPLEGVIPLDVVHRLGEVVEVDRLIPPNTRLNFAITSQRVTAPSETGVLSSIMTDKQEGRIRYYAHLVCLAWQQRREYYLSKIILRLYMCMSHT